ncbi:hypothetical protein ACFU44_16035 [Nocardia rhizosphaerihabitans]|uniref:MmyB family transcriptional regulator n=1 Tax=Nocardia rhizosphaerihabitans TaxID=1691570 RepID=UPI003672324F
MDPLWNVVYANDRFRAELPGVEQYDDNFALWFFHPGTETRTAEAVVVEWDTAAAYLVASLRAAFGIYRRAPQTRALFEKLNRAVTFRQLWTGSLDVAYGFKPDQPVQMRSPDTGEPCTVRIHLGVGAQGNPDIRFCFAYRDPCNRPTTT